MLRQDLRYGSWTAAIVYPVASILGLVIMVSAYYNMSLDNFGEYYIPILGYYFFAAIYQHNYWKNRRHGPYYTGILRIPFTTGLAFGLFYFHRWLFTGPLDLSFGLEETLGHIAMIVSTFLVASFDIGFYSGNLINNRLIEWRFRALIKTMIWYTITWVMWLIFYYSALLSDAHDTLDETNAVGYIAYVQFLVAYMLFQEWLAMEILQQKFPNVYVRGTVSLVICILAAGATFALVELLVTSINDHERFNEMDHVLVVAVCSLIPLTLIAHHTRAFQAYGERWGWANTTAIRYIIVVLGTGAQYAVFYGLSRVLFTESDWAANYAAHFSLSTLAFMLSHDWFMHQWPLSTTTRN